MTDLHPEYIKDRYLNRRKMAWYSFYLFSGMGIFMCIFGVFFGYDAVIIAMWMPISTTMGLWGAVVAGYFTVTYKVDKVEAQKTAYMDPYKGATAAQPAVAVQPIAQGGYDPSADAPDASGGVRV